ncbi:MAG: 3-hydroxyacyl-CoA dehydrogenase NAD-binding domain-containing protein, partial [Alphaproteobacteria bacterium]
MVDRIGVIGAGQMGNGIAHVCAVAGYDVVLADISQDRLDAAMDQMGLNMDRQVRRGLIDEIGKLEALQRIRTTVDYAAFSECDLVIEAATENEAVKRAVFEKLI